MMSRPTPSPWTVHARRSSYKLDGVDVTTVVEINVHHGHERVCGVTIRDEERALANAALIGAAPELRAALRLFVDPHPCRHDHSGACQEHGQGSDDRCPNVVALEALAKVEASP